MSARTIAAPLAAVLAGAVIAGCGDSQTAGTPFEGPSNAPGTTTVTGAFSRLPTAPNGFKDLAGTAKLVRSDGGTDAAIALSGLKPNATYASHVHAGRCDQPDPGGPHFRFVLDGADQPPNEIHLPFTSDAKGNGAANAHSDNTVPLGEGRSIIVHMVDDGEQVAGSSGHSTHGGASDGHAHSHPPKLACAPLDAGGQAQLSADATRARSAAAGGLVVAVKANAPVGGIQSLTLDKGRRVRFTVTSDKPEEVHVHGYDVSQGVTPGKPARFDFPAGIEGIFVFELEGAGVQIVKLTVNP